MHYFFKLKSFTKQNSRSFTSKKSKALNNEWSSNFNPRSYCLNFTIGSLLFSNELVPYNKFWVYLVTNSSTKRKRKSVTKFITEIHIVRNNGCYWIHFSQHVSSRFFSGNRRPKRIPQPEQVLAWVKTIPKEWSHMGEMNMLLQRPFQAFPTIKIWYNFFRSICIVFFFLVLIVHPPGLFE